MVYRLEGLVQRTTPVHGSRTVECDIAQTDIAQTDISQHGSRCRLIFTGGATKNRYIVELLPLVPLRYIIELLPFARPVVV
eukprot:185681-Pleurochrysis_carterae.AAC.1